jgi:hypothetical protein
VSLFNADQQSWMDALGRMPPETKCWCGWDRLGDCYNCKRDGISKSFADKIAVWCPECNNAPSADGARPIIHRRGCSRA